MSSSVPSSSNLQGIRQPDVTHSERVSNQGVQPIHNPTRSTITANPPSIPYTAVMICEKISHFCKKQTLILRYFVRAVWVLPRTSLPTIRAQINEINGFRAKIERCSNERAEKEQVLAAFRQLPNSLVLADFFIEISEAELQKFIEQADPRAIHSLKQRFSNECVRILSIHKSFYSIGVVFDKFKNRNRSSSSSPSTADISNTDPFANRAPREPTPTEEPEYIQFNMRTAYQKERAKSIVIMGKLVADDYIYPGESEALKSKYDCAISHDMMSAPVYHWDNPKEDRFDAVHLLKWMQQKSDPTCQLCKGCLDAEAIVLDTQKQKEIANKLTIAISRMSEELIVSRLKDTLKELCQEPTPNGAVRTIPKQQAKFKLANLIKDLPDHVFVVNREQTTIYEHVKKLFIDQVAST